MISRKQGSTTRQYGEVMLAQFVFTMLTQLLDTRLLEQYITTCFNAKKKWLQDTCIKWYFLVSTTLVAHPCRPQKGPRMKGQTRQKAKDQRDPKRPHNEFSRALGLNTCIKEVPIFTPPAWITAGASKEAKQLYLPGSNPWPPKNGLQHGICLLYTSDAADE